MQQCMKVVVDGEYCSVEVSKLCDFHGDDEAQIQAVWRRYEDSAARIYCIKEKKGVGHVIVLILALLLRPCYILSESQNINEQNRL